jgi:hypothetical protein
VIKSIHYHHRSGIPSSNGYSCHGRDVQGSFQDCFSGCFDQGEICSVTKESVHYPHRPEKSPSKGYSCHGCDEQDSCMVMIEGAHYHHRSGIPPSDEKPPSKGYSYHGCDDQVCYDVEYVNLSTLVRAHSSLDPCQVTSPFYAFCMLGVGSDPRAASPSARRRSICYPQQSAGGRWPSCRSPA